MPLDPLLGTGRPVPGQELGGFRGVLGVVRVGGTATAREAARVERVQPGSELRLLTGALPHPRRSPPRRPHPAGGARHPARRSAPSDHANSPRHSPSCAHACCAPWPRWSKTACAPVTSATTDTHATGASRRAASGPRGPCGAHRGPVGVSWGRSVLRRRRAGRAHQCGVPCGAGGFHRTSTSTSTSTGTGTPDAGRRSATRTEGHVSCGVLRGSGSR